MTHENFVHYALKHGHKAEADQVIVDALEKYAEKGVAFIGVNSNSEVTHPTDDFDNMVKRMDEQLSRFAIG